MFNPFNFVDELLKKQLSKQIAKDDKKIPGLQATWDAMFKEDEGKDNKRKSKKSNKSESSTKQANKTKLETILNLNAESRSCVDAGKYHEAYGILSTQIQLGEEANFATVELNFYKVLTSIGNYAAAESARDRFIKILQENFHTTPKECELLGDKYFFQREYIKAILLYLTGEALFLPTLIETDDLRHCLQGCALGLKLATAKLVNARPDLRVLVTKEVIPGMRRIYNKLRDLATAKTKNAITVQSLCLHHIETTQLEAEDPSIREKTLREALEMMETELGPNEVWKNHLYSCHLHNLGVTLTSLNRPQEAVDIFNDAIKAKESATDFNSYFEKDADLLMVKRGLKEAEEMIKFLNHQQSQEPTLVLSSNAADEERSTELQNRTNTEEVEEVMD